jgi:hypothetical protein
MQRTEVPDLESYEQREDWRWAAYRTAWPIDAPPPDFQRSCEPKLYPEALILWGDGGTTNTSYPRLKVLNDG